MTQDDILYDATLRNLQTLSEATQLLPDELKQQYPDIPPVQKLGATSVWALWSWFILYHTHFVSGFCRPS